jgi:glucose/arabinose dehydrogenase
VATLVVGVGATSGRLVGADSASPSRAAADRPCERAYVRTPVVEPDDLPPLTLLPVARLESPSALAFPPAGLVGVIGQRTGEIFVVHGGDRVDVDDEPVVDLSADTLDTGDGGLLALTYSPDGRWLFAYRADAAGDNVLTAWPVSGGVPDRDRERVILTVGHPGSNQHFGGGLAFGPDGFLYVGTGDGGGHGDPAGNAQDLGSLLGKVLRIDPTPDRAEPYGMPADNPFVGRAGARPEIWAYGLRNPYRLSFDAATGDQWLADVGQTCWEEIDVEWAAVRAGGRNYGWDHREGTHRFEGGGPGGFTDPVHAHGHGDGWCAIVGGFVYRGEALPALAGAYLHTDYCRGDVVALRYQPGGAPQLVDLGVEAEVPVALEPGPDGEPWLLTLGGDVLRIAPASPTAAKRP